MVPHEEEKDVLLEYERIEAFQARILDFLESLKSSGSCSPNQRRTELSEASRYFQQMIAIPDDNPLTSVPQHILDGIESYLKEVVADLDNGSPIPLKVRTSLSSSPQQVNALQEDLLKNRTAVKKEEFFLPSYPPSTPEKSKPIPTSIKSFKKHSNPFSQKPSTSITETTFKTVATFHEVIEILSNSDSDSDSNPSADDDLISIRLPAGKQPKLTVKSPMASSAKVELRIENGVDNQGTRINVLEDSEDIVKRSNLVTRSGTNIIETQSKDKHQKDIPVVDLSIYSQSDSDSESTEEPVRYSPRKSLKRVISMTPPPGKKEKQPRMDPPSSLSPTKKIPCRIAIMEKFLSLGDLSKSPSSADQQVLDNSKYIKDTVALEEESEIIQFEDVQECELSFSEGEDLLDIKPIIDNFHPSLATANFIPFPKSVKTEAITDSEAKPRLFKSEPSNLDQSLIDITNMSHYRDKKNFYVHEQGVKSILLDEKFKLTCPSLTQFQKAASTREFLRSNRLQNGESTQSYMKEYLSKGGLRKKKFCRKKGDMRPYITKSMREALTTSGFSLFRAGDILHIPFTQEEKQIFNHLIEKLISSGRSLNFRTISKYLPGRDENDCRRFYQDKFSGIKANEMIYVHSNEVQSQTPTWYRLHLNQELGHQVKSTKIYHRMIESYKCAGFIKESSGAIVKLAVSPISNFRTICAAAACDDTYNKCGNLVMCNYDQDRICHIEAHKTINYETRDEKYHTVSYAQFSANGRFIYSGSFDKTVKVTEVSTQNVIDCYSCDSRINSIAVSDFYTDLLSSAAEDGDINIACVDQNSGIIQNVSALKFSPSKRVCTDIKFGRENASGRLLFCGFDSTSARKESSGKLGVIELEKQTFLYRYNHPQSSISCIEVSPSGSYFGAGSYGGDILYNKDQGFRIFDANLRQVEEIILIKTNQEDINCIKFSPCERFVASCGTDNQCIVYDWRFPKHPLQQLRHESPVMQSDSGVSCSGWFGPEGVLMTGGSDGVVRIWDIKNANPVITAWELDSTAVCDLVISPDDSLCTIGTDSGSIYFYGIEGATPSFLQRGGR